jgi:hypothetical protein
MGSNMTDVTTATAQNATLKAAYDRKVASESTSLDCRYGQIGILAVAAAVRYQGSAKNPAYAPASNKWRDRMAEVAA